MEKFDKIKEFEKEIAPIMLALAEKCQEHGIPCFINVLPYDDDEHTNARTIVYFGNDDMKSRDCTNQLAVLRDISRGVPMDLLMMIELLIQRFRAVHKASEQEKETRPHSKRSEGDYNPIQEAMLDQVLKQIYGDDAPRGDA